MLTNVFRTILDMEPLENVPWSAKAETIYGMISQQVVDGFGQNLVDGLGRVHGSKPRVPAKWSLP